MTKEPKKSSTGKASEAAKAAHSPDPGTRKEAMATLRDRRGKPGAKPSKKS